MIWLRAGLVGVRKTTNMSHCICQLHLLPFLVQKRVESPCWSLGNKRMVQGTGHSSERSWMAGGACQARAKRMSVTFWIFGLNVGTHTCPKPNSNDCVTCELSDTASNMVWGNLGGLNRCRGLGHTCCCLGLGTLRWAQTCRYFGPRTNDLAPIVSRPTWCWCARRFVPGKVWGSRESW